MGLVDTPRFKSGFPSKECGFDSRPEYKAPNFGALLLFKS